MKTFAQRIAAILALKGESRASLIKRTGISKTSLSDFLAGRTSPSFAMTVALVEAFPEYNARYLLTGLITQKMKDAAKEKKAIESPEVKEFLAEHKLTVGGVKASILRIVSLNCGEVPELLKVMERGEIEGRLYRGDCCCLIGTLAKLKGVHWGALPGHSILEKDNDAEFWFSVIRPGHTPQNNAFSQLAYNWINEYYRSIK